MRHLVRGDARKLVLLPLAVLSMGVTCEDQHIGRRCDLGDLGDIGTTPTGGATGQIATFSSPALECPSRICLLPGAQTDPRSPAQTAMGLPGTGALCTASCASNDDCADGEIGDPSNPADSRCRGGFACRWPATVGDFACQKMCVCVDFLGDPTSGAEKPTACP